MDWMPKTERFSASEPTPHRAYTLPASLPSGWREDKDLCPREQGRAFIHRDGLVVMVSVAVYDDGRWWHHVSMSRAKRMPTYDDMTRVKKLFLGGDAWAVQVFPKASEHVNIHPYCLHLFSTTDPVLPDFTRGSGSI